jgi:hypothetical protein
MYSSARIYLAGPDLGFFFGGFDFGFGEQFAIPAGGFGAQALGWVGIGFLLIGAIDHLHKACG